MLRNQIITIEEIKSEEQRLKSTMDSISIKIDALKESAHSMFEYILTFSELVKNIVFYFDNALDTEERDIACLVFSELYFGNEGLQYTAKEGIAGLLMRFDQSLKNFGSLILTQYEHGLSIIMSMYSLKTYHKPIKTKRMYCIRLILRYIPPRVQKFEGRTSYTQGGHTEQHDFSTLYIHLKIQENQSKFLY